MILGIATASPLRGRLERALADEPGVTVVDVSHLHDLAVVDTPDEHEHEVVLPADPVGHVAELLAADVRATAGSDSISLLAHTRPARPFSNGIGVSFPEPIGPLWARRDGGVLVAASDSPLTGVVAEATGRRGRVRRAIVDSHDFLATIGLATPVIARITGEAPLTVARRLGLVVAEFETS